MAKKYVPWPEDGRTASYSELHGEFRALLGEAFTIEDKPIAGKAIPYDGHDVGESELVSNFHVRDRLTKEYLDDDLEDQGRDRLDVLLNIWFQFGMEQGRRSLKRDGVGSCVEMLQLVTDMTVTQLATLRDMLGLPPKEKGE